VCHSAGKLKNKTTCWWSWPVPPGAQAPTLQSSALALCYAAAEYCAPVWSRSAHTSQVDVQLNSTMRLITGTLRSTPLPWLPVLSNIEPPALRRKVATDNLVEKIVKHDSWPIQPDILNPPLLRLTSRKPCGETQTMFQIVKSCPLTKLNGGLSRLHSADEDAISWLTSYGSWNAYEKKKKTG